MKVGIDIEKISRFRLKEDSVFLKNNFTQKELDYAFSSSKPEKHLCGFFCAKEALIKTLDNQAILLNKIYVSHDSKGAPKIMIMGGKFKEKADFRISISHCDRYATSVVIKCQNTKN